MSSDTRWIHGDSVWTHRAALRHPIMKGRPLIAVVDDDESVRESLPDLLRELGYEAMVFHSAEDFLASGPLSQYGCLLLDVAMPSMSGPELQRELTERKQTIPIVFITGHGGKGVCGNLLEQGAAGCLLKPFSEAALHDALNAALKQR